MSTDFALTKTTENLPDTLSRFIKETGVDLEIGAYYLKNPDDNSHWHPFIIQLTDISDRKSTGERSVWYIEYRSSDDNATWKEDKLSLSDWKNYYSKYRKVTGDLDAILEEGRRIVEGEISIDDYREETPDLDNQAALVGRGSKEMLTTLQESLEKKANRLDMIKSSMNIEISRRRAELEAKISQMNGVLQGFRKQIAKIVKIITSIELYLGINEELVQIQEGEKAPAEEPICFRQLVLYWDEEVRHWKDGGLDHADVDKFDAWLLRDRNLETIIPEKKGVVVLNPRRRRKEYNNNYLNAVHNENNLYDTYVLIRNGECVYRIFTEKITIRGLVFPSQSALEEMMSDFEKKMQDENFINLEKAKEEMEDNIHAYRNQALLLQGLLDRTEVFHPITKPISLFHLERTPDAVRFIYDAGLSLPTGRLSFHQWKKKTNKGIQHGSRVLITGHYKGYGYTSYRDVSHDRIFYYCNEHNYPSPPRAGVYEVDLFKETVTDWLKEDDYEDLKARGLIIGEVTDTRQNRFLKSGGITALGKSDPSDYIKEYYCKYIKEHLTILYNPGDTVYGSWGDYDPHERKKRIRWKIYKEDEFLLNYDQLEIEDIEFYLSSRVDRPNYLEMLPVLEKVSDFLKEEKEKEGPFVDLMARNAQKLLSLREIYYPELYKVVVECVDWWKFKNQIKRPLAKDEAKAFRMIEKEAIRRWKTQSLNGI